MKISIAGRAVGDGEPVFIVAEVGQNHNGNLDIACAMIEQAALAGADAVKFQTIDPDELHEPSHPRYHVCQQFRFSRSQYEVIVRQAQQDDVIFFSTPFDEPSADFLEELGVPLFKIGSGELTHFGLLRHIAKKGRPIVISTGMAEQEWIDQAVRVVKEAGNDQIIVAHCVSIYPTPVELANVRAVPFLRQHLGLLVGYSDHTVSNSAAMAAVALGACYVEKHFTLSRALPEGDNNISSEPKEFKALVEGIREVEPGLGTGKRSVLPAERELISVARRSIYARVALKKGQRITRENIVVRRPSSQIGADQIDQVVGHRAKSDISAGSPVRWDDLSD